MAVHSIFNLLVAAMTVAVAPGWSSLAQAERCASLPGFTPKDSLNVANLKVEYKDLHVALASNGLDLHLRLEPESAWEAAGTSQQREGWIRVFSCQDGRLLQSLEVDGWASPEMFLRFFQLADVNFDGYLDFSTLTEFGAKWGRQKWWVFSAAQNRFVSNNFTEALGELTGNGIMLDAAKRQITAPRLTSGCGSTQDIYRVEQDQLVKIHEEKAALNAGGCTLTARDEVNGELKVTKVRHFAAEPAASAPP